MLFRSNLFDREGGLDLQDENLASARLSVSQFPEVQEADQVLGTSRPSESPRKTLPGGPGEGIPWEPEGRIICEKCGKEEVAVRGSKAIEENRDSMRASMQEAEKNFLLNQL